MRYSASEKFEIIELVEQSSLSIRRTLAPIGIPGGEPRGWILDECKGGLRQKNTWARQRVPLTPARAVRRRRLSSITRAPCRKVMGVPGQRSQAARKVARAT
jgi:hypothetical protein